MKLKLDENLGRMPQELFLRYALKGGATSK
jgi:hypothetical protein